MRIHHKKLAEIEARAGKRSKRYQEANAKYNRTLNRVYHIVSKGVVEYAKKFPTSIIAVENLSELKNDGTTKSQRYAKSMWARARIQKYVVYKATWEEIPVIFIDPRYTSYTCSKCGEMGERNKWQFRCKHCGYTAYVDDNAARNIALSALKIITSAS